MLHASKTWPLTKPNLQCVEQIDRAIIRQICNVKPQEIVTTRSSELLVQVCIEYLDLILKEKRLRWYGHMEPSSGAVERAFAIQVDGKHGPGRPKMTWTQMTEELQSGSSHDRHTLRSCMRSAMRAASQLPGRGYGCCPCTCTLIKNLMI